MEEELVKSFLTDNLCEKKRGGIDEEAAEKKFNTKLQLLSNVTVKWVHPKAEEKTVVGPLFPVFNVLDADEKFYKEKVAKTDIEDFLRVLFLEVDTYQYATAYCRVRMVPKDPGDQKKRFETFWMGLLARNNGGARYEILLLTEDNDRKTKIAKEVSYALLQRQDAYAFKALDVRLRIIPFSSLPLAWFSLYLHIIFRSINPTYFQSLADYATVINNVLDKKSPAERRTIIRNWLCLL